VTGKYYYDYAVVNMMNPLAGLNNMAYLPATQIVVGKTTILLVFITFSFVHPMNQPYIHINSNYISHDISHYAL